MSKLTLSIDDEVILSAKRYAEEHGTSVSRLVESFLDLLGKQSRDDDDPPVLRLLRGAAKDVDASEYPQHILSKYQ